MKKSINLTKYNKPLHFVCSGCGRLKRVNKVKTELSIEGKIDEEITFIPFIELECNKCKSVMFKCDNEISYIISELNRKGYHTDACCSGHKKDGSYPYILFSNLDHYYKGLSDIMMSNLDSLIDDILLLDLYRTKDNRIMLNCGDFLLLDEELKEIHRKEWIKEVKKLVNKLKPIDYNMFKENK